MFQFSLHSKKKKKKKSTRNDLISVSPEKANFDTSHSLKRRKKKPE